MGDILVSTVIPVRNRPALVVEAIDSVLAQTHRPLEIVVVDDASDDATPDVLAGLVERYPGVIRTVRHEQARGPGGARETGRHLARGAYIQYLDSDDLLHPTKFERQVACLETTPEAVLACGDVEVLFELRDGVRRRLRRAPTDLAPFPQMLLHRPWHTVAPLYRRSAADACGPWLATFNEEDWEYDARLASRGGCIVAAAGVVGTMRRHEEGHISGVRRKIRRSLAGQAIARRRVLRYALDAGVPPDAPELQTALRSLFLLARECGAAGLPTHAKHLFQDVARLSRPVRRRDVVTYGHLARLVGWRVPGVLAARVDRVRRALR